MSTQQAILFNDPRAGYPDMPGASKCDTSRDAAREMLGSASSIRANVLRLLKSKPMTTDEVAEKLGLSVLAVRPRFSELQKMGMIEKTDARRPNKSKRMAVVWRVMEDGKPELPEAYRRLIAREKARKLEN